MSQVDYLVNDLLLPSDQKFVCLSFLTDKENKTTLTGIKVRGVFSTYDAACDHAKKLQGLDPYFNVFVGEMGSWLPFDPNPDSEAVKDSEYANDQLNSMMKSYLENQEKAKIYHEQRKNEMMRQNIIDNITSRNNNLKELKKKHIKTKNSSEKQNLESGIKEIEDQLKKMEKQKQELDVSIDDLGNQVKAFAKSQISPPKIIDPDQHT